MPVSTLFISGASPVPCCRFVTRKPAEIGAKIVRHGRYVIFQMAEVAVPRELFREILRLIAGLKAPPTLA
jgi:hypothetical protein